MATFPGGVYSPATKSNGQTIDASHINDLQAEVTAIEGGYLNGTAPLNSSASTVAALSVAGGSTLTTLTAGASTLASLSVTGNSTLGSSVTIGTQPYIFPAAAGTAGQVLTVSSTSGSTQTLGWATPAMGVMTLLKANSGTTTTASAENVDTIAISGLTAKDVIKVVLTCKSTSQATAIPLLYNATDSVTIREINGDGTLASGATAAAEFVISQMQTANTAISCLVSTVLHGNPGAVLGKLSTFTTAWTGSWTLALRHGGVTSGGTFAWSWQVYKIAGQ